MSDGKSNGESGVTHQAVPVMTITVDLVTGLPSYKCTPLPIALWQMWVGEVMKQLEEQRRMMAAQQMRATMEQQARDNALAAALRNKRP